ncbi:hypothetical protein FOZ60_013210 [Perkinsus olseni]|uniref:Uncharacterized protein n=1 Tax=Perkinsus olseni TaxID=32597 RepID=A0A7J6NCI3_PEROL|nr:hypothetical protein FOZ60_013210 [Perkinsus olseni]
MNGSVTYPAPHAYTRLSPAADYRGFSFDTQSVSITLGFHSIFCEHGSPKVLLTDNDRVPFVRKDVKVVLAKHGVKYYTLPGYAQFLSFWERPHKDFVEVTKAIRASTRSDDDNSYIADYLMAVRAYNMTPRLWANLPPAELHFTYGVRVPGERGEYSDEVDWDALKMKYIDTDTIKFMRDGLLVLEDARKDAEVRLYEYLDLWRIRQERNLERMAKNNDRVYSPKLFDIVFTSKSPQHRIGHHLDTIWSGPHTVTGLKGSSVVEVIPGIIFPGLGGVDIDDVDDSRAQSIRQSTLDKNPWPVPPCC